MAGRGQVVVVEDDENTRELLLEVLSIEGFAAVGAASIAEARAALRRAAPACVAVIDLTLSNESGWDLIAEMTTDPQLMPVQVIVTSGDSSPHATARVFAFVRKPFGPSELVSVIRDAFAKGSC